MRLFILSDSPPEKDVQWSEQGMISSYKFIQKLWTLHNEIKKKLSNEPMEIFDNEIDEFTNQTILKITNNLDKFNYNVIIANMYETYNYFNNTIKKKNKLNNLKENYKKILICFTPVIPHFSNHCLDDLDFTNDLIWPAYNKKALIKDEINFVIQINGKKRALIKTKKDISEESLLKVIKLDKNINRYLSNYKIKKVIFVKNRLINILIHV